MPHINSPTHKRTTFSVSPHIAGGITTPEQLRLIADVAEKYNGRLKIVGSSIAIMGLSPADAEAALIELGGDNALFSAKAVRPVIVCPGKPDCPRAQQDSTALGLALDKEFFGYPAPGKVRIGVSGCPNCCAEVFVKDIGLFGLPNGYTLVVGGNAGRKAQIGQPIAENVPSDKVPDLIGKLLTFYSSHGRTGERLGQTLNRVGYETAISQIVPPEYRLK